MVVAATVVVIELAVVVDSHLYSMYAGKGGGTNQKHPPIILVTSLFC